MAQPSTRMRRINETIKEVLAELILQLKDPRIGFVTITEVRTSPDLRRTEVFFTTIPDDDAAREETTAGLDSARPLLRRELGDQLRIRYIPEIHFTYDPVPAHGRRIEELLRDEGGREAP